MAADVKGKAILVTDMPKCCGECYFCRGLNVCYLKRMLEGDGLLTIWTVDKQILDRTKPDWCPLVPMPEYDTESYFPDEYMDGYKDGWNACLDAIGSNLPAS